MFLNVKWFQLYFCSMGTQKQLRDDSRITVQYNLIVPSPWRRFMKRSFALGRLQLQDVGAEKWHLFVFQGADSCTGRVAVPEQSQVAGDVRCGHAHCHGESCTLRSASDALIFRIPYTKLSTVSSRAFSFFAAVSWNTLPLSLRETPTLDTVKRNLKTHLFQQQASTLTNTLCLCFLYMMVQ